MAGAGGGRRRAAAAGAVVAGLVVVAAAVVLGLHLRGSSTGGAEPAPRVPPSSTAPGSTGGPAREPVAAVETESMPEGHGDVADDSAVYADPDDPARSVVIADDKDDDTGGIAVFDMAGHLLQHRQDGKIGNVDLRAGVDLGGRPVVLVGANDRSDDTLQFWEYDPATRRLSDPVTAGPIETFAHNYGFCLYRSASSGDLYAFVDQEDGGRVAQYRLSTGSGRVEAEQVRSFDIGGQTEGCVADDDAGTVYFGEEDVAVWEYGAEPGAGTHRTAVDRVGDHLQADIEGLTLARGADGGGYLLVSSQGSSTVAVYERAGDHAFVRSLRIRGSGDVDGVSSTDGLDASTADLGPGFEHGALVAHDGDNDGGRTSNLKYVPLEQVVDLPPTG